jgi:transcriptional regulator with XRE-family HTH domain
MSTSKQKYPEHEAALGEAIRQLRECRGMTQAELAKAAGEDEATIARIENGEEELYHHTVIELGRKGLKVRIGEIGHLVDQYLGR